MEFGWWFLDYVTIYTAIIVNIIVTWRLEALHQGDHKDHQCQWSKNIRGKNMELFVDEYVW